jgi:hypothetical protein
MTLIAGVRCLDGVVVAADTALSTPDGTVFHGRKLHYHPDPPNYRIAVAYASNHIDMGHMASIAIREGAQKLRDFPATAIRDVIDDAMFGISRRVDANWEPQERPAHDPLLVVGVDTKHEHGVYFAQRGIVKGIRDFGFYGCGADIALHYAARLMLDENKHLFVSTAVAVHLLGLIFRLVKKTDGFVGLDTEIIGMRMNPNAERFFLPSKNAPFWDLQNETDKRIRIATHRALNRYAGSNAIIKMCTDQVNEDMQQFLIEQRTEFPLEKMTMQFIDDGEHDWVTHELDYSVLPPAPSSAASPEPAS